MRYRVEAAAASWNHRELIGAWESAAKSAGLPLAYSEGKRRSPQIFVAVPLPMGVTSDWELVELVLTERVAPADALARLSGALPQGLQAVDIREVGLSGPSIQSQLRWAEYEAEVPAAGASAAEAQRAIDELLAAESLPWEQQREKKVRRYDLRPLVLELRLVGERDGSHQLFMRLRAGQEISGRVDQVVAALGLAAPRRIHRRRLQVEEAQPAVVAYRLAGQPDVG